MWESIKKFFSSFYYLNGYRLGLYLLKNMGIAAGCILALWLAIGTEFTFTALFEWLLALPMISIIVMLVRLAIGFAHLIIPMNPGLIKFIFDFIIFIVVIFAIGYFLGDSFKGVSGVLQTILAVIFDLVYIGSMIFLLRAEKNPILEDEEEL